MGARDKPVHVGATPVQVIVPETSSHLLRASLARPISKPLSQLIVTSDPNWRVLLRMRVPLAGVPGSLQERTKEDKGDWKNKAKMTGWKVYQVLSWMTFHTFFIP